MVIVSHFVGFLKKRENKLSYKNVSRIALKEKTVMMADEIVPGF